MEEALGEKEKRQKEVERGRFVAIADEGGGGFGFRICAEGVEVD